MTKAIIVIEANIDTDHLYQMGLGESSNPQHPPISRVLTAKRDWIWDETHKLLNENYKIVRVSLRKDANK
jgi:hypothetical protein